MYYVYFLRSVKNGKYYTGMTEKHPAKRTREHNSRTDIWTAANCPFELVYFEDYICKTDARKRELFYKTGFGRKIRDAILNTVSAKGGSACG